MDEDALWTDGRFRSGRPGGLPPHSQGRNPMLTKAQRHLARRDAVLKRLIAQVGPCTLRVDPDGFGVLARSIIAQQISTKAALSIGARLLEALGKKGLCPRAVLATPETALRSAGLSANKTR